MKSYNNNNQLKADMISQMRIHMEADQLSKGTYGDENKPTGKFCAVGCALNSLNILQGKKLSTNEHKRFEEELGLPEWLAKLEDTIFEGLPIEESKTFPLCFLESINVGSDLTLVKWKFCAYILKENIERVLLLDIEESLKERVISAIRSSLKVNEDAIATGVWDESAAESARSAAESARSAALSATESAAESAAESAWSAAWSAESARSAAESARSAAELAKESAALSAAYLKHSEEILKLLSEEITN